MIRLVCWLLWAQFCRHRLAALLSMLAMALGVALGYSVHLINTAALADFSRAMKTVHGEPDAVVVARASTGSVPLALINALARDPAVLAVAAVIETRIRIDRLQTPLRLIGIDPFSAAAVMPELLSGDGDDAPAGNLLKGQIMASPALLERLGKHAGDAVTLVRGDQQWQTTIGGTLRIDLGRDELLVADVAWLQEHFGPAGGVSEGRVRLAPETNAANWRTDLAKRLPPDLLLRAADDDATRISNVSRAYRVNLNVLALVALLTGAFLVFATQLTAVAQRSTQFAVLGVLGLSPRMRLLQVLLEGLASGIPGAVLGLALGYLMALAFTQMLGGDLGGGYFSGNTPVIMIEAKALIGFFALGCLASVAGAFYPAVLNRRQPLAQALKSGFVAGRPVSRAKVRYGLPMWLLLAALLLVQLPPVFDLPLAGYAAIALLLVVGIALAPPLTQAVFGWTARRRRLSPPLRLAAQSVAQAPLLAQVAASGLIVSFALTASMVIMVASFRTAVDAWLDHVLPAPLYLRSRATPLANDLLAALAGADSPFVRSEATMHAALTLDPQQPGVALLVREIERDNPGAHLPFTGPLRQPSPEQAVVWVSEPLHEIYGVVPGQILRLPLAGRQVDVFVGGIWRDYSRQFGAIVISRDDFLRLGGRLQASELALWPHPGMEAPSRVWLQPWLDRYGLELADAAAIRALSLSIFDKSFAVTYALEAAALLIGLFALAVTLAASVGLRARELATLSALGFDRRMLSRVVRYEGSLIAAIGVIVGLACGVGIGAILTQAVNPQSFHWRMPLAIPWFMVGTGALLTLAAAVFASHHAARQATRLPVAQVLAGAQ